MEAVMLLSSLFGKSENKCVPEEVIEKIGLSRAANMFAHIVLQKFDSNSNIRVPQVEQFIREEMDGAREGNDYAKTFVRRLSSEIQNYHGALDEAPSHPIDHPGGPQQTLAAICMPLMASNTELAVKLRCSIVEYFFNMWKIQNKKYPADEIQIKTDKLFAGNEIIAHDMIWFTSQCNNDSEYATYLASIVNASVY